MEVEKGTCKCVRGILAVSELFLMLGLGGDTHKKGAGIFRDDGATDVSLVARLLFKVTSRQVLLLILKPLGRLHGLSSSAHRTSDQK